MSYNQLTENERYQIYASKKARYSQTDIAALLERSPSTISRELARNTELRGYRLKQAQRFAEARRKTAYKARKVAAEVSTLLEALIR
jgi:IS30 family transposase